MDIDRQDRTRIFVMQDEFREPMKLLPRVVLATLVALCLSASAGWGGPETESSMTRGTVSAHDGEPIHYEVFGDDGPFIFLAHATAEYGTPQVQAEYIEALGDRFRLIFIEYPGPVAKQRTSTPDAVASDYLAIADAAGAENFHTTATPGAA